MRKSNVLLVLLALAFVIAGCGGKSDSPGAASSPAAPASSAAGSPSASATDSEPQTIEWWVPNWDEEAAKKLIAKFEEANPNIKVDMVLTTWDTMENKIRVAFMSKEVPDVITDLESRVQNYAAQGFLMNLDSYYEQGPGKDDFITSALEINSYNGSVYGLPFRHDGSGVLYNKKMFRDAGLDPEQFPKTWDEFVAAARKLTKDGQYGTAWPLGNQTNAVTRYLQLLYSEGGDVLSADGKQAALNTPQAVTAMTKLTDTIKSGVAPKSTMELDNTTLRGLFVGEKIAMYVGGQFDIPPIKEENPNLELGTAVIPGPAGMGVSTVNGFSLLVPEASDKKDAALKLVDFIAQPENMAELTATFPGRKSALALPKFADPLLKPFADQLEQGKSEPAYANWPAMEKAIFKAIQLVVLSNTDVQKAVDQMNAEVAAAIR